MLDSLVHGQDGHVSGAPEAARTIQPPQAHQHIGRTVRSAEDRVDVIGPWHVQQVFGNASRLMGQQVVGIVSEKLHNTIDL